MKKYKSGLLGAALILLVSGAYSVNHRNHTDSSEYALYIYMCGSTLESNKGAGSSNITELLNADMPEDMQIVIETGGAKQWKDHGIANNQISRFLIKDHELKLIETVKDCSMGDENTLTEFLEFSMNKYPARKTGLILWDHGNGTNGEICYDENHDNDSLSLTELDTSLKKAVELNHEKFDWIGFDACLMANYDIANTICNYADHMIASEELEPSNGWNYQAVVENYECADLYEKILEGYQSKYESRSDYTLSWIDMEEFSNVRSTLDHFTQYLNDMPESGLQRIVKKADETICFGNNSRMEGYSNLIDLGLFASQLEYVQMYKAVTQSVKCVNGEQKSTAVGLSIYFPFANSKSLPGYLSIGTNENYCSFLKVRFINHYHEDTIQWEDAGSALDGELNISLKDKSKEYVKSIAYKLYQLDDSEGNTKAVSLGMDNDISEGEYGSHTSFGGEWASWNNELIQTEVIDESPIGTTFSTPVFRNGRSGVIRFLYDISKREFTIQGFIEDGLESGNERLEPVQYGDEITLRHRVLDENYNETFENSSTFIYKEGQCMKVQTVPDGYYQYYIVVTDVYGAQYKSNTIVVEAKSGEISIVTITKDDVIDAM